MAAEALGGWRWNFVESMGHPLRLNFWQKSRSGQVTELWRNKFRKCLRWKSPVLWCKLGQSSPPAAPSCVEVVRAATRRRRRRSKIFIMIRLSKEFLLAYHWKAKSCHFIANRTGKLSAKHFLKIIFMFRKGYTLFFSFRNMFHEIYRTKGII